MKTRLGKIIFEKNAPSIKDIIGAAPSHVGVNLDYVSLGIQTYLVIFEGNPNWGAKVISGNDFIEITDEGGTIEGPVVAQAVLRIAKKLGGHGPENDKYIQFPLTPDSISGYEKMYLEVRPSVPRVVTHSFSALIILVLLILTLVLWLAA